MQPFKTVLRSFIYFSKEYGHLREQKTQEFKSGSEQVQFFWVRNITEKYGKFWAF